MSGAWNTRRSQRTVWRAPDLGFVDEPLLFSLVKYRRSKDRWPDPDGNLFSSLTEDGRHMPIIDLDQAHSVVPSSTSHHSHLYLNGAPIPHWRWVCLMTGLWLGGQIELGYFVWSLRRGANFVRRPGEQKQPGPESTAYTYGWLFKIRK